MKNRVAKLLSIFLVIALLVGASPVRLAVYAEERRDMILVCQEEYRKELCADRGLADEIAEAEYRFPYASP